MPDPSKTSELVVRSLEEEQRLTERAQLKKERQELVRARRLEEIRNIHANVKLNAARIMNLRKYMFRDDKELTAAGLTPQQKRIVRQFEEPKKATAFGVESAAKLLEAEIRANSEKASVKINVENAVIQLPEKKAEQIAPIVIDVEVENK